MRALAAAMAVAMAASPALADENPLFFQATVATQAHPSFHAPYSGMNSLHPEAESALSVVMDLGARIHPWIGAEIVVQPELAGGRGLSSTLGVAAYPSGEVYRIGNPEPALILAKLSLRQTAGPVTVTLGKLSTPDLFDNNPVSNDPHMRFMSWGLWASAAYDYPADVRGATWGIALDYTHLWWSARAGMFLEPQVANGATLERDFTKARGLVGQLEARSERGAVRVLGFMNTAHMGSYAAHRAYLASGGYGFLIGDGALRYGTEVLAEVFYRAALSEQVSLGVNYQPLFNPAFNRDRGPVHIFTARAHVAF